VKNAEEQITEKGTVNHGPMPVARRSTTHADRGLTTGNLAVDFQEF